MSRLTGRRKTAVFVESAYDPEQENEEEIPLTEGERTPLTARQLRVMDTLLRSARMSFSGHNAMERGSITTSLGEDFTEILNFVQQEADMAPTTDDEGNPLTHHALLEKIRQKKEIIGKLRCQPWSMRRKKRALRLAHKYLERHEARVSKRHLYQEEIAKRWKRFQRWLSNFTIYLIPWESKIKKIENQFGSVVSSYFTFLRWIFWINMIITLLVVFAIVIPEYVQDMNAANQNLIKDKYLRKNLTDRELQVADYFQTVWDFKGHIEKSAFFYGWYAPRNDLNYKRVEHWYNVPIAYFLVNLFVLGYSFFAILRKMAANTRQSKMTSGKAEQYVFCWKTFTGWDFTIANAETANNSVMSNVIKLRESIAEYRVRIGTKLSVSRALLRILANILILGLMALSIFVIQKSVERSQDMNDLTKDVPFNMLGQNEVAVVVSLITLVFPNLFELVGAMEGLHPRNALRFQLARVYVLYALNYYTLIFSLMEMMNRSQAESNLDEVLSNQTLGRSGRALQSPLNMSRFAYQMSTVRPYGTSEIIINNPTAQLRRQPTTPNPYVRAPVFAPSMTDEALDLCWETVIGQEISKLITMDLVMTVASILIIDFLRGLWVRYCHEWWFWNLETSFPEYGEFKVAENVLHIINNQGMIWLGLFFSPLLPALNNVKLMIIMYIRAWAVTTCNVPAQQIFRASRSSNFYLGLLLVMLFLCTLPVGYVIGMQKPSPHCGPFSGKAHFYTVLSDWTNNNLPEWALSFLAAMKSPGVILPSLLLLTLLIYFLISLVRGLKEANTDLKKQLLHERTEEKKKIFDLAGAVNRKDGLTGPSMPEQTKVDLSYLPEVEKRRRQPWRRESYQQNDESDISDAESDLDQDTPRHPPKHQPKQHAHPAPGQGVPEHESMPSPHLPVPHDENTAGRRNTFDRISEQSEESSKLQSVQDERATQSPLESPETPRDIREFLLKMENDGPTNRGPHRFPSPTNAVYHQPVAWSSDNSARSGSLISNYDNPTTSDTEMESDPDGGKPAAGWFDALGLSTLLGIKKDSLEGAVPVVVPKSDTKNTLVDLGTTDEDESATKRTESAPEFDRDTTQSITPSPRTQRRQKESMPDQLSPDSSGKPERIQMTESVIYQRELPSDSLIPKLSPKLGAKFTPEHRLHTPNTRSIQTKPDNVKDPFSLEPPLIPQTKSHDSENIIPPSGDSHQQNAPSTPGRMLGDVLLRRAQIEQQKSASPSAPTTEHSRLIASTSDHEESPTPVTRKRPKFKIAVTSTNRTKHDADPQASLARRCVIRQHILDKNNTTTTPSTASTSRQSQQKQSEL